MEIELFKLAKDEKRIQDAVRQNMIEFKSMKTSDKVGLGEQLFLKAPVIERCFQMLTDEVYETGVELDKAKLHIDELEKDLSNPDKERI